MGKQGPCYHCGVTSTPLWRNGPPEKPVLCNACGSRWRTKGTLSNYTPLHARAEPVDSEDFGLPKVKTISIKTKEPKLHKRKHCSISDEVEGGKPDTDQHFWKILEEDTSNRSSTGSAISYSESCSQFSVNDLNDLTGPGQSNVWDSLVPSKKRTCINRPKPSSVEKLTKDLNCLLQEQQSSYLSVSSEEDLLFESETPVGSVEIGHGGVLIKYPNLTARDEESVASSFLIENKVQTVNEDYSGSSIHSVNVEHKGVTSPNACKEKVKQIMGQGGQEHAKRDKFYHEKSHTLRNSHSPLRFIDLKDVVNFEEFVKHFSHQEQQHLMKHLPSIDTAKPPESLKNMFSSPQFAEDLTSFQQLLLEGIFDLSFPGITADECKILKRLVLVNLSKSKWVEHYKLLKDANCKQIMGGNGIYDEPGSVVGNPPPVRVARDSQNQKFSEPKGTMKSPKRVQKTGSISLPYIRTPQLNSGDGKSGFDAKDLMENDGSCFSPRSLFASPPDSNSVLLDPLHFAEDTSDQDLLLDVPSSLSFPHAELLIGHPLWKQRPLAEKKH